MPMTGVPPRAIIRSSLITVVDAPFTDVHLLGDVRQMFQGCAACQKTTGHQGACAKHPRRPAGPRARGRLRATISSYFGIVLDGNDGTLFYWDRRREPVQLTFEQTLAAGAIRFAVEMRSNVCLTILTSRIIGTATESTFIRTVRFATGPKSLE